MQLAIGLLTASLDSAELEAWATWALIPENPEALGDVIAGLHIVNLLLLDLLHEATGQPPSATLQQLAISAAAEPGMPFALQPTADTAIAAATVCDCAGPHGQPWQPCHAGQEPPVPSAAEISWIACASAGLTLCPASLWAAATLLATVRTKRR
jgi:hypothetical protein